MARAVSCNVTDPDSRAKCIEIAAVPGTKLNVFLAFAQMPDQEAMDRDPTLAYQMIDATYSGPVALLHALAPAFEQQRCGRIVIVGSVAGDRGRRKNYLYGSAKAGLAAYAEGLRARLLRYGVSVTLAKPGFIDTSMTWGLRGSFLLARPDKCALAILRAAERGRAEIYYPFFWWFIMLVVRHIPGFVMKRLQF